MGLIIIFLLSGLFLASVLLGAASRCLPTKELKRRARSGKDPRSAAIYRAAAYGGSLELLLVLTGALSAAGLLMIAADTSGWLLVGLVLVIGWLVLRRVPPVLSGWQWGAAALVAPLASGLLSLLQPVFGRVAAWMEQHRLLSSHTGVFEKEDLLELLNSQAHQPDSRIPEAELKMAKGALTFGDKSVGSIMTPRRVIKMVAATDTIGPLLMDELHTSGFSRFPVVKELTKSANPEIIGMLYLHDLIDHTDKGKVRDVMKKKVSFINETQTLRDALAAILKTENHLLVVVNNFEETVGVITIEDIIEQILGEKIIDEFDRYDDMRAVAGVEASKEESKHSSPEVVE